MFSVLNKVDILKVCFEEKMLEEKIELFEETENLKMLPLFFIKNVVISTVLLSVSLLFTL